VSTRTVICAKLGKELPGLSKPPFSGVLGQEIYDRISAEAWQSWSGDMQIKVINEYRLNLADPEQYAKLISQMRAFLALDENQQVLDVGDEKRGRG
jgi:Fe-S cluster biosynthesis and repair protein YggX